MTNKETTFERDKILLIRLDPLCDKLYNLIILLLSFILDVSSNKWVVFEIMALVKKNILYLMKN